MKVWLVWYGSPCDGMNLEKIFHEKESALEYLTNLGAKYHEPESYYFLNKDLDLDEGHWWGMDHYNISCEEVE